MEDFSLIILCRGQRHLLPLTLDTLKPQNGSFEVLLLDGEGSGRLSELAHSYPELKIRVQNAEARNLAEMMNEGLGLARGKYIQFLEPGDRYISQHGLEFLSTLIKQEPHLVYAHSLVKGGISNDEFITARFPWFLKSKLFELGGFDRRLSSCPSMDLLCRLFRDQKTQAVFCRRVLVDSDAEAEVPLRESYKILYRHFGLFRALKWLFFQDRSQWFRKAGAFFKGAFWKGEG
jgi:glycosyltransferase involved in cell wall biosynthesis